MKMGENAGDYGKRVSEGDLVQHNVPYLLDHGVVAVSG